MRPRVLAQLALMVFCLEGLQAAPLGEQAESTDSASTYTAPSQGGLLELLHQLELLRNQRMICSSCVNSKKKSILISIPVWLFWKNWRLH